MWMTLFVSPSGRPMARLGISAPRRVGGAARRNRLKRLIREAFRTIRHELPPADWIVVPHPGRDPTVEQICNSLRQLSAQLAKRMGAVRDGQSGAASSED